MSDDNFLTFHYTFTFPDGKVKKFPVLLDEHTLAIRTDPPAQAPEWTRLEHCQCENCPLRASETPYCPIARNLTGVIDTFKDVLSYERAKVEIKTANRTYSADTPLQSAVGSLIGLFMVTSGCPVMDKLKPMVRSHLPFATSEETFYRAVSMYLTAQFLLLKRGHKPDWDLKGLVELYDGVRTVNKGFVARLTSLEMKDAAMNAVVILDCFADTAQFLITGDRLADLEKSFNAYLAE